MTSRKSSARPLAIADDGAVSVPPLGELLTAPDPPRVVDGPKPLDDAASLAKTRKAEASDLLLGAVLNGAYRVERLLGEGGMGRVYEARHTRIQQKRVAIKVLRGEFARNSEVLMRFQREAEAAASISHPNVIAAYDVDRTPDGLPYIACEHLEGVDLHEYVKQVGKLSLESAIMIARQLCDGLSAAHASGVIHRDLKPHNIFLVGDFSDGMPDRPLVKILDFGLSKFVDAQGDQVTKAGIVMGTPAFMPPEQARGQLADRRSDVYGVGAILYNLLTGRPPFDEASAQATVLAVMSKEPPRPRSIVASIPEHAELVIQRAMAKEPSERYPDMHALRQALGPLLLTNSLPPAPAVPPQRRALGSRAALDLDGEPTRAARLRLVAYGLVFGGLTLASAAVALTGIERAWARPFSSAEIGLITGFALLAAATPTLLWFRHVKREVWSSTVRVLGLLSHLRAGVLTWLLSYGAAWLGARVVDRVVPRFSARSAQFGLEWAGWDLLIPTVVALAVSAVLWRRRLLQRPKVSLRDRALAVVLSLTPLLATAAALALGVGLQTSVPPRSAAQNAALDAPSPSATPSESSAAVTLPVKATAAQASAMPAAVTDAAASTEELRAALAQGTPGLEALSRAYPRDPNPLRALVLANASKASGHADALAAAKRLFQLKPPSTEPDVVLIVAQIAELRDASADAALDLAADAMGAAGLDLLFRLMLTRPALAPRIRERLAKDGARQRMSEALAIAFDLRVATSCADRVPLLPRAAEVGDERSFGALAALSTGAPRGCGRNKRKPCSPACPHEAATFRKTMDAISRRMQSANKAP